MENERKTASPKRHTIHSIIRFALFAAACSALSYESINAREAPREVSLADLIGMRTIDSLTLSPDQRRVAFRVITPNVAANTLDENWYTVDLDGASEPVRIGGVAAPELMPMFDVSPELQPIWLSDGRGILVRRMDANGAQVHQLGPDGLDVAVTAGDADVERFDITSDGLTLTYATRASRSDVAAVEEIEADEGIHFDQTILTEGTALTRGFLDGKMWTSLRRGDDQSYGPAHGGPLREKKQTLPGTLRAVPRPMARSAAIEFGDGDPTRRRLSWNGGTVGFVEVKDGVERRRPRFQIDHLSGSHQQPCLAFECIGNIWSFRLLAAASDGSLYLLREDEGSARTKLFTFDPRSGQSRQVFDPLGSLDGGGPLTSSCLQAGDELVCVHAGPTSPPRLVTVDLRKPKIRPLHDPNEDLRARVFPITRPMIWLDRLGRSMNGILVLPRRIKGPAPLVIATYRCRGLLRGGTAQVAPEFMLAQKGFVVLCANNNPANEDLPPADPSDPSLKKHKIDIDGYRAAIERLASEGLVDRKRVGIAGHSYSGNSIAYAVSHTDLFRAAVIGSGISVDSASYWVSAPAAGATQRRNDVLAVNGLPHPDHDHNEIWAINGPSLNAARVKAAILMQPPESEYLMLTQFYAAIQDHGGIADMFVFPGAAHMFGRYPKQQLNRAQRSIDWFDFWLAGGACHSTAYPVWRKFADKAAAGMC